MCLLYQNMPKTLFYYAQYCSLAKETMAIVKYAISNLMVQGNVELFQKQCRLLGIE